jgi:hypothetical protein
MSERQSKNPIFLALLVLSVVGGGWFFLQRYEISGLDQLQINPRGGDAVASAGGDSVLEGAFVDTSWSAPHGDESRAALIGSNQRITSSLASTRSPAQTAASSGSTDELATKPIDDPQMASASRPVRVGSWALAGFDRNKLAKPHVMDWFARVVRQFDVIALQQLTSPERDLLPRMIAKVNQTGRRYDFVLGPVVGPQGADIGRLGEQYAFLFDADRIETDRGQTYTVADPGNRVGYDPLVGWFRVRGVPASRAWTFTLVNFRVDSSQPNREVGLIGQLIDSVAQDGRQEDDLLLCGMLHADDRQLLGLLGRATSDVAVVATPTDIFARYQLSNIVSPKLATTEYLGRGGVIDFPTAFDLNQAAAEELSPHLPVFAEFTPTEGN